MPKGAYSYADGSVERFSCAPGPAGWRYVSAYDDGRRVDLTCDSIWRQLRVELGLPGLVFRGGAVGEEVLWVVGDAAERSVPAAGFLGGSPAFVIATARRLGPQPGGVRVPLARVGPGGATSAVEQHWRLAETTVHEGLPVEHWAVTDLVTGDGADWHVCGDVVLAGPGVELSELDSPPTLAPDSA